MKTPNRHLILLAGAIILIAGHGFILYYFSSRLVLPTAVIAGVIVLVVIKHLGLLGPFYTILRKVWRRSWIK